MRNPSRLLLGTVVLPAGLLVACGAPFESSPTGTGTTTTTGGTGATSGGTGGTGGKTSSSGSTGSGGTTGTGGSTGGTGGTGGITGSTTTIDAGPTLGCVPVALNGDDTMADGTASHPFATVGHALAWASDTMYPGRPHLVCVAAGPACGTAAAPVKGTYPSNSGGTIVMVSGVDVVGNYESTTWTVCTGANTTTVLQPGIPEGVVFSGTTKPTRLEGFQIDRFGVSSTSYNAGITVTGSTGVVIKSVNISNSPTVSTSYGINVIGASDATITGQSHIDAGDGSIEAIGVRASGAKVHIQGLCGGPIDGMGRCASSCGSGIPSVRGRTAGGTPAAGSRSYGVLLDKATGSVIETSSICANDAVTGAAIRVKNDATGVVIKTSYVSGFGGTADSHGIWLEDCNGAHPTITKNAGIHGQGPAGSQSDAIRAIGDCHPTIDGNALVAGGSEFGAASPTGVHCGPNTANVGSQCVITNNTSILGSIALYPTTSTAVRCDEGSCLTISNNTMSGRGGQTSAGLFLQRTTGLTVNANTITGGCGIQAIGVGTLDAVAQLNNNLIYGNDPAGCPAGAPTLATAGGILVTQSGVAAAVDVNSNDIDGVGQPNAACGSFGIQLAPPPNSFTSGTSSGTFRNNILRGGACTTKHADFVEAVAGLSAKVFENNDLDTFYGVTTLYLQAGTLALTTAALVNAIAPAVTTASGNISADPRYKAYGPTFDLRLNGGSPCIDAGTATGAPANDFLGLPRSQGHDIGAYER